MDEEIYQDLKDNFSLLCEIIREPSKNQKLKADLGRVDSIIRKEIPEAFEKNAPEDFYVLFADFKSEYDRFRDFILYEKLIGKNVVALGGGFSSGKSSFLNALMGDSFLPEDIDPTTAIPTYIVRGREEAHGLNAFDAQITLNLRNDLKKIVHGFGELEGEDDRNMTDSVTLGHILKSVFCSTPRQTYEHLAFLDTPGYSKPDGEEYSLKTDERIAREQLNASNFILWFVPAERGTIPQADINFIRKLRDGIPKMIIVSKSDKKDISNLRKIIERIKEDLNRKGIQFADVRAFSSQREQVSEPELARFLKADAQAIRAQLNAWNATRYETTFARNFKKLFVRCKSYYESKISEEGRKLLCLNPPLTMFRGDEAVMEPLERLADVYKSEIASLRGVLKNVERLQEAFFTEIKKISDQVGIQMPEPDEIDLIDVDEELFSRTLEGIQKEASPETFALVRDAGNAAKKTLAEMPATAPPFENPALKNRTDYLSDGYFKTLALIPSAQDSGITDGQRAALSRMLAGAGESFRPEIIAQARKMSLNEYAEYMDNLKVLPLRYRFALDAVLLACCGSQDEDALKVAASMLDSLRIDRATAEYLCALAKSVLQQDSEALWRARSMEKHADCEEGLFYDYIRQFIKDWVFVSDTRIDIRFLERKSIETIPHGVLVHMESIANSTSNERRTAYFENVYFPGSKSSGRHHDWAFRNYDKITFKRCTFYRNEPASFTDFDPKRFKPWDSWTRCLYFADVNRIQFEECGFYNCKGVMIGEKNVQNASFEKCRFENCLLLHMGGYGWSPLGALIHDDGTLGTNTICHSEFVDCGGIGKQLIEVSAFLSNCKCIVKGNRFVRCRHYCGTTRIDPKKTDNEKGKKATLFLPGTVDEYNTLINSVKISDTPGLMKFCDMKQGRYHISTALKNNMLLDVDAVGGASRNGTNVRIYSANWTDAQDFTIQHVQGEWYVIQHTASGKVLDVAGKNPRSGTNVFLWEYLGADNQLWSFIPKNGGYMIQSKLGTFLDVCGAGTKDGTNVWAYEKMNNDAQLWYLTSVR